MAIEAIENVHDQWSYLLNLVIFIAMWVYQRVDGQFFLCHKRLTGYTKKYCFWYSI